MSRLAGSAVGGDRCGFVTNSSASVVNQFIMFSTSPEVELLMILMRKEGVESPSTWLCAREPRHLRGSRPGAGLACSFFDRPLQLHKAFGRE
jgi:hypothetical protein